jgi:hypothetical protein
VSLEAPGNLQILYDGYHDVHGGIYVTGKTAKIVLPSLEDAVELILEILRDYDFISPGDKSRAVASFLSPAMRHGRLLGEADFPIDIGEADDSQSGKPFGKSWSTQSTVRPLTSSPIVKVASVP